MERKMFGKTMVRDMINRSAENETDRRLFLTAAGVAGRGTIGAGAATVLGTSPANAAGRGPSDGAIFNFALNLEYLEAQFYSYAAYGNGLDSKLLSGKGDRGGVVGGHQVPFKTGAIAAMAREIAQDEIAHVGFLRKALGGAKVAQPNIDLKKSFTAAATAAGLIKPGQSFDPFADENSFLLGAFIFEDVGVTAYKGAAPMINNKAFLGAAAGILAVEAYHAGIIRTRLYDRGLFKAVQAISDARDSLDGTRNIDQGIGTATTRFRSNLVPTNKNALVYDRTAGQVLNVVYLNPKSVKKGGFFPKGVNGAINTSA